jgi:predicted RNase H-like HicB family nuclease
MVSCEEAGEAMKKYAVVIERGADNMSAYVPDLPGCITTGRTIEEIERNIREAIELHLEGMAEDGEPIPEPRTLALEIEVPFAA